MTKRLLSLAMCVLLSCDYYKVSILNIESESKLIIMQNERSVIYDMREKDNNIMFIVNSGEIDINKPSDIEIITADKRYSKENVILKDYIIENTNQIALDTGVFTEVK